MLYENLDELMVIDRSIKELYLKRQGLETEFVHLNVQIMDLQTGMNKRRQSFEQRPNTLGAIFEKYMLNRQAKKMEGLVAEKNGVQYEFNECNQELESSLRGAYEEEFGPGKTIEKAAEAKQSKEVTPFGARIEKAQATEKATAYSAEVKEASKTMK